MSTYDIPGLVEQVRELQAECLRVDEANTRLGERVCELQAVRDTYREHWRRLMRDYEAVFKERDELEAERDAAREQVRQRDEVIERVRGALAGHPECDRYPNDGGEPILCGWKRAVVDVRAALEGDG